MLIRAAILALSISICLTGASEDYQGKAIAGIQFEPEKQPLALEQLLALIPLRAGQPLHPFDIQVAIQKLYATGEYADIAVDATQLGTGVNLKFITKPAYFVGHVGVSGVPEPPNAGQLGIATKLLLGTQYSEQNVELALEHLLDAVKRNGFYNAKVERKLRFEEPTQQVNIDFSFDSGKRAKFDGVLVTGHALRPTQDIANSSHWKRFFRFLGWSTLTEVRLQSGLDGIRSWYPKHDHLLAKVRLTNLAYHDESNTVTPELDIDSGPKVDVRIRGAKLSGGRMRTLLPIYEEHSVDKDLLMEGERDLGSYFQAQGYFDVTVSYTTALPPNGDEYIEYVVAPGIRHKIVKLGIEGNRYFKDDVIRERMSIIPASWLRYRHGKYSRDALERDLNTIRYLYRSNGFRDVDVTSREVDDFNNKPGEIGVFVEIKEGPQWFVSKFEIDGVLPADRNRVLAALHSTQGQPYSDLNVASDRDSILDYYYNNGYPEAKFEFTTTAAQEANKVDIKFTVTPGRRVYVRNVLVSGLGRTREDLVMERIDLHAGDALSQSKITGSQRRLYDLGIFARVDAALQNPDGDEPTKNVLYSLEEANRYTTNIGFGAEIGRIGGGTTTLDSPAGTTGFSPRVSFGISRLNFLGLGHTVGLQTLLSTLEQRVLLSYLAPQLKGHQALSLQFTGLFDISHDIRTFSSQREEGSVQLGQKVSKSLTAQYRLTFRKVDVIGIPLISPELIPLLSQPVRVGAISTSLIQDRRDDALDAHRGIYNTIDVAYATKALGSQTTFGRIVARNSTYYQLNKSLVLARSTSFGVIDRFGGLPEIPLAERFFAGGSQSNRAFPDNQAGPRDTVTGFPIGGNALFVNSVELRFPLIGENIGGVLFNDMGNVYSSLRDLSLRFRQRDLQDFNYAVQSFGLGIRYRTPIGPVRVDFSLSPNSPRFFGFKGTEEQLLFGGGQQVVQRINVFQFHFSLGQAF